MAETDPVELKALLENVTQDPLTLVRYDHGGGRLFRDDTATGGGRELVADFYGQGANRELYSQAPTLARQVLALSDEVARLRDELETRRAG